MPRLFLTRRFQTSFEKLDPKMKKRVKDALLRIQEDPGAGKKLTGDLSGDFSLRVGDYRIIYTTEAQDVWIETVRHRKDVYKRK